MMAGVRFDHHDLEETEDVLGVFYGGRGQVGGQLVVTNRRLLFGPLDTATARALVLRDPIPGAATIKDVLDAYEPLKKKQVWLRHIKSVVPLENGGLFAAPSLRITTVTEERIDYGIVKTTWSPNIDPRNRAARDEAVATIHRAAEAAKAQPDQP